MPPRRNPTMDMLIAQAQQKMRELKELQFFGGDALNLGRWSTTINVPGDGTKHCWRVVVTPDDVKTTLPFMAELKPATATSYQGGQVEAVHRTDGNFEYLIIADNFAAEARPMKITIEYTGKATFSITQIG
jgi:hypothetical protein